MVLTQQPPPHADLFAASMMPVVRAIGYEHALALATRFGGMCLYLRENPADDDPVSLVVGRDARAALLSVLGPGAWQVPQCRGWLLARRDEEICLRYVAGEPVNDLAFRFRLTRRHIFRVLADDGLAPQPPAEDRQTGLFDHSNAITAPHHQETAP